MKSDARINGRPVKKVGETVLSCLSDTLLIWLGAFGALYAVAGGFQLYLFPVLLAFITGISALCMVLFQRHRIARVAGPCVLLLITFTLCYAYTEEMAEGFLYIGAQIFRFLCWGFPGLPMPRLFSGADALLTAGPISEASVAEIVRAESLFVLPVAILITMLIGWLYADRRSPFSAAIPPIPFAVLCFLIIDATLPPILALVCLGLFWLILLFSGTGIRARAPMRAKQILCLAPILLLLLGGIYLICPRQGYENGSFSVKLEHTFDSIMSALSTVGDLIPSSDSGVSFGSGWLSSSAEGESVSLDTLSKRGYLNRTVMQVQSESTGVVYLREKSYDHYDGKTWSSTEQDALPGWYHYMHTAEVLRDSNMTYRSLRIKGAHADYLFLPYHPYYVGATYEPDGDRGLRNVNDAGDYTVSYYEFTGNFSDLYGKSVSEHVNRYGGTADTRYWGTAGADAALGRIIAREELYAGPNRVWETVSRVTEYVQNLVPYSLRPDTMPKDESDFALWFLEDAESGYCVHFATAATLLLRACRIPARMAVGYLVVLDGSDRYIPVKDADAHAWVEVFDDRLGWLPVEATPAGGLTQLRGDRDDGRGDGGEDTDPPSPVTTAPDPEETTAPPEEHTTDDIPSSDTEKDPSHSQTDSEPADTAEEKAPPGGGGLGFGFGNREDLPEGALYVDLRYPLAVLSAIGLFFLCRMLLYRRRRTLARLLRGDYGEATRNRALLMLYDRALTLSRCAGVPLPDTFLTIAEKAKFSTHTVTEAEYDSVSRWYRTQAAALSAEDTVWKKLYHRFICALY